VLRRPFPDYELTHIELLVETTAKGEIRFIGGASAEIKGGIKIVFERQTRPSR
jgi:hypothetical protein